MFDSAGWVKIEINENFTFDGIMYCKGGTYFIHPDVVDLITEKFGDKFKTIESPEDKSMQKKPSRRKRVTE